MCASRQPRLFSGETANSSASRRMMSRFSAEVSTRSSSGRPHGSPQPGATRVVTQVVASQADAANPAMTTTWATRTRRRRSTAAAGIRRLACLGARRGRVRRRSRRATAGRSDASGSIASGWSRSSSATATSTTSRPTRERNGATSPLSMSSGAKISMTNSVTPPIRGRTIRREFLWRFPPPGPLIVT